MFFRLDKPSFAAGWKKFETGRKNHHAATAERRTQSQDWAKYCHNKVCADICNLSELKRRPQVLIVQGWRLFQKGKNLFPPENVFVFFPVHFIKNIYFLLGFASFNISKAMYLSRNFHGFDMLLRTSLPVVLISASVPWNPLVNG